MRRGKHAIGTDSVGASRRASFRRTAQGGEPRPAAQRREPRTENGIFTARAALVIFAVALAVRLIHLWQLRSSPFVDVLLGDAKSYDEWAQRLAAGDWLGRDVFYQAPLYPYVLGAVYSVVGHDPMLARVLQAVASACACVLLAWTARRLFSPAAAWLTGLGLGLCAPAIFADGLLQKSSLDLLTVCLGLFLISGLVTRPDRRTAWVGLGATVGTLILTRENSSLLLLPLLAWVAADRTASARTRVTRAACLLLGTMVIMAPVTIRNAVVGHGLYPTTAQFGPNLYIGNHHGASGRYEPLRPGRGAPEFERRDAIDLAEAAVGRPLSPAEVSQYWTHRSVTFAISEPREWARVTLRKLLLLVNAAEIADSESQESHAEWSTVLTLLGPFTNVGVLGPLAVLGVWCLRRRWRELWVLPALILTYAISVVAFYILARYRYPLLPFAILFGAAGIVELPRVWRATSPRHRLGLLVTVTATIAVTSWPMIADNSPRALTENNLGTALQMSGRLDDALTHYQTALALDSEYLEAHLNAGTVFAGTGRAREARAEFETAIRLQPDSARAHYFLGRVLADEGLVPEAIAQLQTAVALTPDAEDMRTALAAALADHDELPLAIVHFREAVRLAPTMVRAHWNLGMALHGAGDPAEAVTHLTRAVDLSGRDGNLRRDLATALLDAGDFEGAVREFKASLTLLPPTADTWNRLGVALVKIGDITSGIDAFRQSLVLKPDFADARNNLQASLADRSRSIQHR